MLDKLRAKLTRQKLHDFDLEHPTLHRVLSNNGETVLYEYNSFKCKHCNKSLGLDLWQMKQLPWEMKIGCK